MYKNVQCVNHILVIVFQQKIDAANDSPQFHVDRNSVIHLCFVYPQLSQNTKHLSILFLPSFLTLSTTSTTTHHLPKMLFKVSLIYREPLKNASQVV